MSHLSKRGDVMDAVKDVVVRVSTSCRKWLEATRRQCGCDHGRHRKTVGSYCLPSHTAFEQPAAMQQTGQTKQPRMKEGLPAHCVPGF
jgi:hypothetical protein